MSWLVGKLGLDDSIGLRDDGLLSRLRSSELINFLWLKHSAIRSPFGGT